MADVRPFRGVRYSSQLAGDLPQLICPPFDTIPPALQQSLYQRSPYNVVRLEAGDRLPSDSPQQDRYTRAATLFTDWIQQGVLVQDEEPAFYLVQHIFRSGGKDRARLELMGCVRLEEYDRRVVLPHEYTRDEDKRDRMALMQACHANFSPIMCLYRDEGGRLSATLRSVMAGPTLMDFSDAGEQGYRIWKIEHPKQTGEIGEALASRPLYIADGHHRYETALGYRDLEAELRGGVQGQDEAFNFVMMGLTEFDDPGLMVLPYHRFAGGLSARALTQIRDRLSKLFDFEPSPQGTQGQLKRLLEQIELRGKDGLILGLLDSEGDGFQLLTLKQGTVLDARGPVARSEAWILEEQVLNPILGDSVGQRLDYAHDGNEVEDKVRRGEYQLGFFLKPFPLDLFEAIMNKGQRLPPKSTFFYPKLATGLVINLLEGRL